MAKSINTYIMSPGCTWIQGSLLMGSVSDAKARGGTGSSYSWRAPSAVPRAASRWGSHFRAGSSLFRSSQLIHDATGCSNAARVDLIADPWQIIRLVWWWIIRKARGSSFHFFWTPPVKCQPFIFQKVWTFLNHQPQTDATDRLTGTQLSY